MKQFQATSFAELVVHLHCELDAHRVDHAFGGALALAYHVTSPRATDDIDLSVAAQPGQNLLDVFRALPSGLRWDQRSVRMAEVTGAVKLPWVQGIPVDLFFPLDDYHQVALGRAELHRFSGTIMKFVTATDLTILKATFDRGMDVSGKLRDWLDVRLMLEAGTVDCSEAERWISEIAGRGSPELTAFLDLSAEVAKYPAPSASRTADGYRPPAIATDRPRRDAGSCGYWMPRAKRRCRRPGGHGGRHQ